MKSFIGIIAICMIFISSLIFFSPYGKNNNYAYKLVEHSVIINASAKKAFDYLGVSKNASDWSVFVSHISPLNEDKIVDGEPGSIRRCFVQKDEKGMQWDELIIEVQPNIKRQLLIYNFVEFPMTSETAMATEQLYTVLDENTCKVTFTVFFKDDIPSYFETFKMYVAAYQIKDTFEDNMDNIKRIVENNKT